MKNWTPRLSQLIQQSEQLELLNSANIPELYPRHYRDDFDVDEAFADAIKIEQLLKRQCMQVRLIDDHTSSHFAIKLYALGESVMLSRSMTILESMGLTVEMEKPYLLNCEKNSIWIHHFTIQRGHEACIQDRDKLPRYFEELFTSVWHGETENDAFNQLLFTTCIKSRNIAILRAYTAYLHQITFPYSQSLIIHTLVEHPQITLKLVKLFLYRFDPNKNRSKDFRNAREEYLQMLNDIASLDQDLIFKQLLSLIDATVRTNYYQPSQQNNAYISFKFKSGDIQNLPHPHPLYEIFVYSSRFEGIHLRGGKVARGGLRWSDRKEDYRTEVLGLMKAQMVKNAVIVPAGSKGGFITKQIVGMSRDELFEEVKTCYQLYIHSLLELTDNMIKGEITHPIATRIHDQDDPYLVVAADKGTATFSDTANSVSEQQEFWLQDAFASGGSAGYDHKKMGITARGAWESVKRHFRYLGKDIQSEPFTVIGIGDMSGDVFGNGMLLSRHIKLVAAFNHLHIFIDPNPDPESSFLERERLFKLPRSGWNDYNSKLISKGGGVYSRSLKSIKMNEQMKMLTGSSLDQVTPDQLIKLLLKSSIELLWNGGIGTYVKSSLESNEIVKDKHNDGLRVDGKELKVKVVGEGGNLGFTQMGRVEYAKNGGLVYTDSIDNSAGVDCSDHEVNLKIMLSRLVLQNQMSLEQRNALLESMTDDVAELCLQNNYDQTQILNIISMLSADLMHEHDRFIRHLESHKVLNRRLEYLPNNESIVNRIANNQGLTRPELCILLSYSKLTYKSALLESNISEEQFADDILINYFPKAVQSVYRDEILSHPLRREIIATQLANQVINTIGPGFGFRMREETGANIASIGKAFVVCSNIFNTSPLWRALQQLDNQVSENSLYQAFRMVSGLLERGISWILRHHPAGIQVEELIKRYHDDCHRLRKVIPHALTGQVRKTYTQTRRSLLKQGYPAEIAQELAENSIMASALDIIEIKIAQHSGTENTARLFFAISERLQLNWIRDRISETNVRNHWHQLAIANMRNELHGYQQQLTSQVLQSISNKRHTTKALKLWIDRYGFAIHRYDKILSELQALRKLDFTMTSVAVSEVRRLLTLKP